MESKERVAQIMLRDVEGLAGSAGRNISRMNASKIEESEMFGLRGFRIEWRKKGMPPIFLPVENIKCVILEVKEAKKDKKK